MHECGGYEVRKQSRFELRILKEEALLSICCSTLPFVRTCCRTAWESVVSRIRIGQLREAMARSFVGHT